MATTQLFIELLVIGIGVAIWLAFLLVAILGYPRGAAVPSSDGPLVVAFWGVAYLLGILVDRAAYSLFLPLERRHRDRVFAQNGEPPVGDRERFILVRSTALRDQVLYNRSRLRICRSWILNFFLTSVCAGFLSLQQRNWPLASVALASLLLGIFAAYTMNALARDHYLNIRASYDFLAQHDKRDAG